GPRDDLRPLIELPEDPAVVPAHLGETVGTPLRHADPVPVSGAVEREAARGIGRNGTREQRHEQREQRHNGERQATHRPLQPYPPARRRTPVASTGWCGPLSLTTPRRISRCS